MEKNRLPHHHKSGFRIPEAYLENLEEQLLSKVIPTAPASSLLRDREKVFAVPDNYFTDFEERLMQTVQGQKKKKSRLIPLFKKEAFYYVAGVAAVLLAIVTTTSTPQPDTLSLESLDLLSLESYLEESVDYSHPEVSGFISEGNSGFATSGPSNKIDQDILMEYLHENIEEPFLIFNEN